MSGRLILVRHGQSHGNVARRLDTRPPGAELTDLGHDQARRFAGTLGVRPSILAHSVARRAAQTAAGIGVETGLAPFEFEGVHEVQVGELEDRSDDGAVAEFNRVYQRWHQGELDVPMPGGESAEAVLARYVPVITELRMRYLDDQDFHSDIVLVSHGAAIRLVAAVLAGVDGSFALDHHLANTESVVLAPITDGRWSCVQWAALTPPFYPEPAAVPVPDAVSCETDPMG
ncbi:MULTISPECIES: histidine phosphatase family protein [unclassified Mycolicibacterium]|uniref:histidine phosphatase family protein n=1 Tax=unclassified Mycolicibacterium TaxID=2636767 RepID=UPI0012DE9578|nr:MULTISPECIES: histidine phosphatase family protein [unclassified Mycolicibacterium]MUL83211.1 histidine phosphatase family protein [Mycolicibacterium sp. CBMA 329]MUL89546.1 histidine phosphatase family protein [Mycolicibacterium sp. CBMA 331]MUM02698.1 histidine phosphatase family protein [Mycolicibacterium sp. CBMA 334]MUM27345.1 histidine phosphatase family protein [Mycolicibacterium sp. CBMA 295]MUM39062.1 histidine phosphatase family protein [Mycolicibacterium sp. CBMA 247]